jgi:PAS domain S-box-containing protein
MNFSVAGGATWLKKVQKIAKLGFWDQDISTKTLVWSDSTYQIFGLQPQEEKMDFNKFLSMVHPDDREKIIRATQQAQASDKNPYNIEYQVIRPDNTVRFVHEEAIIDRNENGTAIRLIGFIQDTTERKQQETLLRESERRYKEAQQIAKLGHWELNLETNTLFCSDEICRIFDIEPQVGQLSYDMMIEAIHPDDRECVKRSRAESFKNKTKYDNEYRIITKNGDVKWIREIGYTKFGKDNKPARAVGVAHDITEIKVLRGIIPICAKCKMIRADDGYWHQVEQYISEHSQAEFSHGMCEKCTDELYSGQEWYEKEKDKIVGKKV